MQSDKSFLPRQRVASVGDGGNTARAGAATGDITAAAEAET